MNNWISIFAHITDKMTIYTMISGEEAKIVLFWLFTLEHLYEQRYGNVFQSSSHKLL